MWLMLVSSQPEAQINEYYENVKVELITMSPGEYYWEAFGHSAIRVKSRVDDKIFGFGYFDFADEDFFVKFAKGDMQYFLGVVESERELESYKQQGRKIAVQNLQLSIKQKKRLIKKLFTLAQPKNKYYHYDYFLNNCTSRIRDILDEVTGGEISAQLKSVATNKSWNDLTFPVINQTWMNLGISMGYGLPAYYARNQWQLSVFPEIFSHDIKSIKTLGGWNRDYQLLFKPTKVDSAFMQYDFIKTHYAILLCVFVLFLGVIIKTTSTVTIVFWLITQSVVGVLLCMLWFLTQHTIAAWNINVLLFLPFSFLLIFNRLKKPMLINGFLIINIIWLILASMMTNLYLIGFCIINIMIWNKLSRQGKSSSHIS